jgi:hypothetical protein
MTTQNTTTQLDIKVMPDGQLQIKEATIITEGDKEVSKTYFRKVIDVGADVSNEVQEIQDIAAQEHTSERIASRESFRAANTV